MSAQPSVEGGGGGGGEGEGGGGAGGGGGVGGGGGGRQGGRGHHGYILSRPTHNSNPSKAA